MCSSDSVIGDVLDDVAALVAERNRLDAALARAVRAAEVSQAPERDGQKSMASWLRGHCRLSSAVASRLVTAGRALEHLPVLAEAADAGLVTAEQVAEAARLVTPQRLASLAAAGVDLAEVDGVLTGVAVEADHAALVQVVNAYLAALDPDGPEPDPTGGRSLTISKHADGSLAGGSTSTRWVGRSCRRRWRRTCRPTGPPGTTGPAPSGRGMRWCSWPTTLWPPARRRCCAA
jgi:hypothetical protein